MPATMLTDPDEAVRAFTSDVLRVSAASDVEADRLFIDLMPGFVVSRVAPAAREAFVDAALGPAE